MTRYQSANEAQRVADHLRTKIHALDPRHEANTIRRLEDMRRDAQLQANHLRYLARGEPPDNNIQRKYKEKTSERG